jgi:hypothetical protein
MAGGPVRDVADLRLAQSRRAGGTAHARTADGRTRRDDAEAHGGGVAASTAAEAQRQVHVRYRDTIVPRRSSSSAWRRMPTSWDRAGSQRCCRRYSQRGRACVRSRRRRNFRRRSLNSNVRLEHRFHDSFPPHARDCPAPRHRDDASVRESLGGRGRERDRRPVQTIAASRGTIRAVIHATGEVAGTRRRADRGRAGSGAGRGGSHADGDRVRKAMSSSASRHYI